jgi:hypothetical protein
LKRIVFILSAFIALSILSPACGRLTKLWTDEIMVAALRNKQSTIVEAVKFSLGVTYNSTLRNFPSAGVNDSIMRKKIQSLGSEVYVKYEKENAPASLPDSTVIFTSFHDVGTIEIIFDFATDERELHSIIPKEKKFYLKKVGERTYYRRGPEPY